MFECGWWESIVRRLSLLILLLLTESIIPFMRRLSMALVGEAAQQLANVPIDGAYPQQVHLALASEPTSMSVAWVTMRDVGERGAATGDGVSVHYGESPN